MEYVCTEIAATLWPVFTAMVKRAAEHLDEVEQTRRRFEHAEPHLV